MKRISVARQALSPTGNESISSLIRGEIQSLADPEKAAFLIRYFRVVPGGYGEGDRFLGIPVPVLRRVARKYRDLATLETIDDLIQDPFHEIRLAALLLLTELYNGRTGRDEKERIFQFYMDHLQFVNNWDLVDSSAPLLIGAHLYGGSTELLFQLARSENLWHQRIALLATLAFIRKGLFQPTLAIVEMLLNNPHDLIQKAAGWMLREIGKRSLATETAFLEKYHSAMPRTMLRYAMEKVPADLKKRFK